MAPLPRRIPSDVARLERVPWVAKLLADDNFVWTPTSSRTPKESGEDSFIAETLNTNQTIRSWITQHSLPIDNRKPAIREVRSILDLGLGLNGYAAVMHGGMVATLLDEITGVLLTINVHHNNRSSNTEEGLNSMTAYLNVTYKKPLPLPSIALSTAKLTKVDGRKYYIRGTLEDGNGQVYASGEALFIEMKPKL